MTFVIKLFLRVYEGFMLVVSAHIDLTGAYYCFWYCWRIVAIDSGASVLISD